jgi:anti-sigma factor RsiW
MSQGFDPFDPEEWGDKPGCSAFETALEMRRRGALAPGAVPVLDAHLAACDACRDHALLLGRVDASLLATAASPPDARRLRAKLDDAFKQSRRAPWIAAGIGLVGSAALLLIFGRRMAHYRWLLFLNIPLLVLTGSLASYTHVIRLRRLLAEPDAVVAYRRWLEGGLKRMRWLPLAMALNAFVIAPPMRGNWRRYAAGDARAGVYLFVGIVGIVLMVLVLIMEWRHRRRMKAELAELR